MSIKPMRGLHGINARLEFKPQDLWVGVYWKDKDGWFDLWVCVLPCLPVHVWWTHMRERGEP